MMSPITIQARSAQARQLRPIYAILLVIAVIDLGSILLHPPRLSSHPRPYGWVFPVGLLCMAVGGLTGVRHPLLHRVLIGVALVFAVWSVVVAIRT